MPSPTQVDVTLLKMEGNANSNGRSTSGINQLIGSIHTELSSAQRMQINVRKGFMYLLLKEDMRKYNEELEKTGRCIWLDIL